MYPSPNKSSNRRNPLLNDLGHDYETRTNRWAELLNAFQSQPCDATFENFYHATSGYVFKFAFKLTNSRWTAEELTQDVFVKFASYIKRGKNIRDPNKVTQWLQKVTKRRFLSAYVKRDFQGTIKAMDPSLLEQLATDPANDPCFAMAEIEADQELASALDEAFHSLPSKHQNCLRMVCFQGLPVKDVASLLKKKADQVSNMKSYALKRMAKHPAIQKWHEKNTR